MMNSILGKTTNSTTAFLAIVIIIVGFFHACCIFSTDCCPPDKAELHSPMPGTTASAPHYLTSPVAIEWEPENCPMIVHIYHNEALVFPRDSHQAFEAGLQVPLLADPTPYELKLWLPGATRPYATSWLRVGPTPRTKLEEQFLFWDIYEEENLEGEAPICETPQLAVIPGAIGGALRLTRAGPRYANCHFYVNRPASNAQSFTLDLRFYIDRLGSCNNEGGLNSLVQALEFTISTWVGEKRYEWAVQYENVTDGSTLAGEAPTWRVWTHHPTIPDSLTWVPIAGAGRQCLQERTWYHLVLGGNLDQDTTRYRHFSVDGASWDLSRYSHRFQLDPPGDKVAVAVQLNGNGEGERYAIFVDEVGYKEE